MTYCTHSCTIYSASGTPLQVRQEPTRVDTGAPDKNYDFDNTQHHTILTDTQLHHSKSTLLEVESSIFVLLSLGTTNYNPSSLNSQKKLFISRTVPQLTWIGRRKKFQTCIF